MEIKIMKTKICTDIEQSKKLAEVLSIKSADMWWNFYSVTMDNTTPQIIHLDTPWVGNFNWNNKSDNIPCWSLAALLVVLQKTAYFIDEDTNVMLDSYKTVEWDLGINNSDLELVTESNPVDACYEMIIKLHEQNLL